MKKFTKILSAFIALAMALVLITPVNAAGSHTITITNEKSGHTYEAYQVFAGDFYEGKLSNITWGESVDGNALLAELNTLDAYKDCTSAEDVAEVVKGFTNNSEQLDTFAEVAGKHLTNPSGTSTEATEKVEGKYVYTISDLEDGYYLVKDKDNTVNADEDAYTKYIIQVLDDVELAAKADAPTLEKKIVEGESKVDANNAALGENVNYELTSKVPNMDGYNEYYFVVEDTLSNGLTFNDDVTITIGNTTLTKNEDFVVTNNEGTIKIVIKDFIEYKASVDADITIKYSAKVNENALIGDEGNPNTAKLVYSNNPNFNYGTTDEPQTNEPTGKTPEDTVITYVTEITINKTDGSQPLTGAEFTISGVSTKTVLVTGVVYVEDTEGTFWELVNGSYTTIDPNGNGVDTSKYVNTTVKYKEVTYTKEELVSEDVSFTAFVGADGKLVFTGLAEGTYTITEITAPNGYNKLKQPITVVIDWENPTSENFTEDDSIWTWTATVEGKDTTGTGNVNFTVVNNAGTTLPSTGGMGTTLIYIIGGIMVAGAAVLLIAKKRMEGTK